ncbi:hypothetical protein GCM10010185_14200 [Saccharothrix coeruleofusca]|uniref:Uncharacterized protein n=1 Tax=Saccharothrix coeruleofusca TaxID=33919 RepID=A0A918ECY6_9PSEU|nr:hypothetical protein [Saccharothrix coeruleofusca]GGP43681.1 hypothetical protein GCM10010185_14200 [Saccharothrix coeruleofusca]
MVVHSLRRLLAAAALCASFGVVTATTASANAGTPCQEGTAVEQTASCTFTPPYTQP